MAGDNKSKKSVALILVSTVLVLSIASTTSFVPTLQGVSASSVAENQLRQMSSLVIHTAPWLGIELSTTIKEVSGNIFEVTFIVWLTTLMNTTIDYVPSINNNNFTEINAFTGLKMYTDPFYIQPSSEKWLSSDLWDFTDTITFDIPLNPQKSLMEENFNFTGTIYLYITTDEQTNLNSSRMDLMVNLPQFTANLQGGYQFAYIANRSFAFEINNNISPYALLGDVGPFETLIPIYLGLSFTESIPTSPVVIITAVSTLLGSVAMIEFKKEKELIMQNISSFITMWVAYPYFTDNVIEQVLAILTCIVFVSTLLYLRRRKNLKRR